MTATEPRIISYRVRRDLDAEDKMRIGDQLAEVVQRVQEIKYQEKEAKARFKARLEECEREAAELTRQKLQGWDFIDVDCEERIDDATHTMRLVRIDTGEIVLTKRIWRNGASAK